MWLRAPKLQIKTAAYRNFGPAPLNATSTSVLWERISGKPIGHLYNETLTPDHPSLPQLQESFDTLLNFKAMSESNLAQRCQAHPRSSD